jgi:hypothetical protein
MRRAAVDAAEALGAFLTPGRLSIHLDGMHRTDLFADSAAGTGIVGKEAFGLQREPVEHRIDQRRF